MAITKEAIVEKIEIVGIWNVQVASDTVIKEDGTEIGRSNLVYWCGSRRRNIKLQRQ